jgi:LysR family transcriptional regulator, benzoate and cis,cis-muconate-responsive activator of ben and cat genes
MNRAGIYELECFVAVAEELNFSRAARRLHLSQPPLSRQIQSLEEKLGVRLFDRNTRSVTLTSAGMLYLQDIRQILTRLDAATASVRRANTGEILRLNLAFVGVLLEEAMVGVLQSFRKLHPRCQIHLMDLPPAAQLNALQSGHVDGAFIGAAPHKLNKGLSAVIWKREPLLIALPEGHPCAAGKKVSLSALKNENWVMVARAAAPAYRRQFDRLSMEAGIYPRVVQESERVPAVLTMVAAQQGISLLPEAVSRLVHPGVVFRGVKGTVPMLEHAFVYRSAKENQLVTDFLNLLARRTVNRRSHRGPQTTVGKFQSVGEAANRSPVKGGR